MYYDYYLEQLNYYNKPEFLEKYLNLPSLNRLKKISYFCGMDYASKDIYHFRESITRFDHSLSVALLVYHLTKDKNATLAGLFHDIATPCFSHVIDYMNEDYEKQESTEEYTEKIIQNDSSLGSYLKRDGLRIDDIINFKKYSVVDNDRPKMCADRIDGVILTGIGWTKNLFKDDIKNIVQDLSIYNNEDDEEEIGFYNYDIASRVVDISQSIDIYCHSREDNYMMQLLANITRMAIQKGYIHYEDLYIYAEDQLFLLLKSIDDEQLKLMISIFETVKKEEIIDIDLPKIKVRSLNPLVNGKRLL